MTYLRRHRFILNVFLVALMSIWQIGQPLQAASINWTAGSSTDFNWASPANWSAGVPTAADDVFFLTPVPNPGVLLNPRVLTLGAGSLANSLSFKDNYTLTGGDLAFGAAGVRVELGMTASIGSQIIGTNGFTKTGGGSVRLLNNSNSYTGPTAISNGSLIINNQSALGADSTPIVVTGTATRGFGGGSLVLDGTSNAVTITRNLSLQGLGSIADRSAALISVGNNTLSGTVNAGVGLINTRITSATGLLTFSGPLDIAGTQGTTITILGGAANQTGTGMYSITGALTGTGTLEKSGVGTLLLTPSSTAGFSGSLRVSSSATGTSSSVRITTPNVLGTRTSTGTAAVLDLNGGFLEVLMDTPSVLAGGAAANLYGRANTSTVFVDHAPTGTAINGTLTFGQLSYEDNITKAFTSRNGYSVTIGATPVVGGDNNSGFTNNLAGGGLLSFTGTFWSNADNAANRTMTIGGNGNTLISGNITASAAGFDHSLTKTGTGTLTITSVASTLDGAVNVNGGTVAITDFRSITNNTSTINIGTTTTSGALTIGTATAATLAGLTTSKVINLAGTTGGATINASQAGTNPVTLNAAFTATGGAVGDAKTLTLGGTNTADNIINGAIPNNGAGGSVALTKLDAGTWVLAGTNSYSGTTTISNGTLKLRANAATSTIINNASGITFAATAIGFAGSTLEFVGQSGVNNIETLGTLTPTNGANTIRLTPGGSGGTASLVFNTLSGVVGTSGVNIVGSNATNTVTLTGVATGLASPTIYFDGSNFAYSASGVLRAPIYGADAGFTTSAAALTATSNNEITGSFSTNSLTINTLKISGAQTLTLNAAQTLTVRIGAANTVGGILATGGSSTITGGTGITTGGSGALAIRVNEGSQLTISTPLTSGTTGGITKNGAGTLVLSSTNAATGTFTLNEGTVRLSGTGTLGAGSTALASRQLTVLDLNGVTPANTTGNFNSNGIITNGSSTPVTLTVGGSNGTGTSNGVMQNGTGVLNITKIGTGGMTWNGLSTYTGVTNIGSTGIVTVPVLSNINSASGIGAGNGTSTATNQASLVFSGASASQAYGGLSYTGVSTISIDRLFTFGGTAADSGARIQANGTNGAAIIWNNTNALAFGTSNIAQGLVLGGASTGDNRFNPQITDNGSERVRLFKADAGVWHLGNANNSYTGTTTITAGQLVATSGTSLPTNSPLVINGGQFLTSGQFVRNLVATAIPGNSNEVVWTAGGGFAASTSPLVVALGGIATPTPLTWASGGFLPTGNLILNSSIALSDVDFRNAIDLNGATRTIQVDNNANTATDYATVSGIISGATGSITKTGNGILSLTGANTYGGTTNVTAGTLVVSSLGNSGTTGATSVGDQLTANTDTSAIVLGNTTTGAGLLQYVGPGETSDRKIRLQGTTATNQIHADGSGPLILTNVAHDTTSTGNKSLFLRGTNTAGNMVTSTLANNGAGILGVTVDGGATWILPNANTYTGTTVVGAGALGVGHDSALGVGGNIDLGSASIFAYTSDRSIVNPVRLSNNTVIATVGEYSFNFTQPLQLLATANNVGLTNNLVAGKSVTFAGAIANAVLTANRTFTIDGSGETIINGDFTNTAPVFGIALTKTGTGTLSLGGTGASNFNQNNAVVDVDRGVLKLIGNNAISFAAGAGGLTLSPELATADIATFDLNGRSQTINALTATTDGTVVIDNTAATAASLTFGANNSTVNFGNGLGTYTITDSGLGALSITKTGNTTTTIPSNVTLSYQGSTNVSGGSLTLSSSVNGTIALSVTNSGSILRLTGGITTPTAITSVVVENGGTLSLLDGAGNKLTSLTNLQLGSSGGTNTSLNFNVGDISVAGDELNTDTFTLTAAGTLALFTGNQITFNLTDTGLNANQTYELLNFSTGGFTSGALTSSDYLLGATPGGFTSITLTANNSSVFITTGNLITGASYWRGLTNTTWNANANNWSQDKAGATPALSIPGQGTDVIFQWDAATNAAVTTTLEQNFKINSLSFEASTTPANTPTAVTINPGAIATSRLEIAPQNATDGIKVTAGGPASVTVSGPVRLGANQTWGVADATSTLSLGAMQGEADVTKTGLGKVTLTAAADPTFNGGDTSDLTINAGTVEILDSGSLGTAANNNVAGVTINSTALFYFNNVTAGTVANPFTLNGGTLATGSGVGVASLNHTYSGNIAISADSTVSTRDLGTNVATGGTRSVTLSGVLSGAGKLTVNGNTAIAAGTSISGTVVLTQANPLWTGGLLLQQGTIDARQESSLGTGAVTINLGRIFFKGAQGTTWSQFANGFTLNNPGSNAVVELQPDNQGTPGVFTTDITGTTTLGSATSSPFMRVYHADTLSALRISGPVVLGNNASIHTSGLATAGYQPVLIDGVISDGGSGFGVNFNGDTVWNSNNYQVTRLSGANTFTGNLTLSAGPLEFSTVSNIGGAASNLGQGSAISIGTGTLRFIGGTSQSTDRPITTTGAATLSANGTAGASITYAGAISVGPTADGTQFILTGIAGSTGILTGGFTQTGDAADAAVNGGIWNHNAGTSRVGDDLTVNTGAIVNLNGGLFQVRDDFIVTGADAILNLNATGVLSFDTPALSGDALLEPRAGGTIVLGANNPVVLNQFDSLRVGTNADGVGTLNMSSFNWTINEFLLANRNLLRSGLVNGTGTLTVTGNFDIYRGTINAPLASTGTNTLDKLGLGIVTLTGNNSGLASTGATVVSEGTLVLDYTLDNNTKVRAASALDMRGGILQIVGNSAAATSQNVGGLNLATGGSSTIQVTGGTGQDAVLNLGAITRANGAQDGTVRFILPAGTQTATNGITTTALNTNGIIGGYATVRDGTGASFATNATNTSGGNIVALASTVNNDVSTWALGDNITDETTGFTGTIQSANINSLRFNAAGGSDLNLSDPTGVLSIASGGILITNNVTSGTNGILGGNLASGTAEIIVIQDSVQSFEISSDIRLNHAITKSGTGTLLLSGNNVYTDETEIQEGTLRISGGNAIGDTSLVTLGTGRNSTLELLSSETIGRLAGGQRNTDTELGTVAIGTHTLTINQSANTTYSGFLTGSGNIVMNAGNTGNLNLNNVSSGFTGTVTVNGGLFQLSNTGQVNASSITINRTAAMLLDNNGGTRSGARILDTTPIILNSADGTFSGETRPRGLAFRTDQDSGTSNTETIGSLSFASGANYAHLENQGGNSSRAFINASSFARTNSATLNVRGRALGSNSATGGQSQLKIVDGPNEVAFLATLVGGVDYTAGADNNKIVPWAIGQNLTGGLADGNMGNSLVTYIDNRGFAALDLATEYNTYTASVDSTDNIRESLAANLTSLPGKTVNALVIDNNNTAAINVTGSGAGQTLVNTSGAFLFTLSNGVNSTAYSTTLGGFDTGITVGSTNEYVIHVVNPSSSTTTPTLNVTIASNLTSTADITKSGRGTLILTGNNTAGGGTRRTTLNEGTLEIADLDNIGGDTGSLVFAGGTLRLGAALTDDVSIRSISILSGGATIDTNGLSPVFANSIGSGIGGFTKIGAGNLTLNATATYTGPTVITTGTVTVGANNALGNGGNLTIGAGATLALGTSSITSGLVTTGGASPLITGTGTITASRGFVLNHTGDTTIDAVLAGPGGVFKAQSNSVTLTGANTYTGITEVQAGGLSFNTIANVGGGASALGAPTTIENGIIRMGLTTAATSLTYTGTGNSSDRLIAMQGTTGGLTLNGNGTGAIVYGGVKGFTSGSKTLTLAGTSDAALINNVGGIDEGVAVLAVTKNGANTWAISSASNYSGLTTVSNGTLRISHATALGSATAGTTITGGNTSAAVLELTNNITVTGETLLLEARQAAAIDNSHVRNLSGNNTWAGDINFATGGSNYNIESAAGLLTLSGQISGAATTGARSLRFTGTGNGLASGTIVNGSATVSLTKLGAGTWTLTGSNTYSGVTTVSGGTLLVNNLTGSGTGSGSVSVETGAILGGTGTISGSVTSNGTISPGSLDGSSVSTIGQLSVDTLMAVTGSEILLQIGGVTTLDTAGVDSYLANPSGFSVPASWTDYQAGVTQHDQVRVTGSTGPVLNTTIRVSDTYLNGFTPNYGEIFQLLDWATLGTNNVTGTQNFNLPTLTSGFNWNTSLFTSHGVIFVVPEPSRLMLVFLGLLMLCFRRRR